MTFLLRLFGIVCAVVAISATNVRAQTTEVRVAMLAPSSLLWLHAIAKNQGFYAERHIKVEELRAGSSPALLQAVSSGSVDAGISLGDLVIRAVDKGAQIVIAGAILDKTPMRMIGARDVTKVSDLRGATVTAGAVKGGTANLMRYEFKTNGVDPSSVKMVAITNSRDRLVALRNGQVKGALLIAPFDTQAVRDKMHVLYVYKKPFLQTPLIFNKAWAAKHKKAAVALTKALQQAANWIYKPANKQKAIAILASYTKIPADICADSYKFLVEEQKAFAKNLEVPADSLKNIIDISKAVGGTPASSKPFELARYYDPSFLAAK